MSDGVKQRPPMALHHQGSDAPWADRRPGYPLSGCVPAEPDSVSPGSVRLASAQQCGKPPSDTGVMPQKILLYRFPTEKRSRSYPHTLEKSHSNQACRCYPLSVLESQTTARPDRYHRSRSVPEPESSRLGSPAAPSPSRTSIVVQASSGSFLHQASTRMKGLRGRGPRPEYSGGGASRSRISVFEGTASRYRLPRLRNSSRKPEGRPISSSPAIHMCGSTPPHSSNISNAS